MNFTARDLLDLARRIPCTLRVTGCTSEPTGPCHSNQQRHGKGKGIKAHDVFHVAGCDNCHRWLDSSNAPMHVKVDAFERALEETWLLYWTRGYVMVTPKRGASVAKKEAPAKADVLPRILPRTKPWA